MNDLDRLMKLIIIGAVLSMLGAGSWAGREYSHWKERKAWQTSYATAIAAVRKKTALLDLTTAKLDTLRDRERASRAKAQADSIAAAAARDTAAAYADRAEALARRIRQVRDSADQVLLVLDDSIEAWVPRVVNTALEAERAARRKAEHAIVVDGHETASVRSELVDCRATSAAQGEALAKANDVIAAQRDQIATLEQKPERPSRFKEGVAIGGIVVLGLLYLLAR